MMIFIDSSKYNFVCHCCGWSTGGIRINDQVYCIVCKSKLWRCSKCGHLGSAHNGQCYNRGQNLNVTEKKNERVYEKV